VVVKHWLAYSFLFILSFQVLPVKQLGQWLYKGQLNEEVYEADGKTNESEQEKQIATSIDKQCVTYTHHVNELLYSNYAVHTAIHFTEMIPVSYVAELFSPPPNMFA